MHVNWSCSSGTINPAGVPLETEPEIVLANLINISTRDNNSEPEIVLANLINISTRENY